MLSSVLQVGGNRQAREFFKSQEDFDESQPIAEKYNTRAAALYRDKVCVSVFIQVKTFFFKSLTLMHARSLALMRGLIKNSARYNIKKISSSHSRQLCSLRQSGGITVFFF